MNRTARSLSLLVLTSSATLLPACRSKTDPPPPPAPIASAPAPQRADQVAPGELAEGTEKAFGIPIPRRMRVRMRFADEVVATGDVSAEQVANYIRQRVQAAKVETGPAKTVFTGVTAAGEPPRQLRIEVLSRRHHGTDLTIQDVTKVPPEPGLTDEERWRAKGFKPDGTPLDPTRLE
ncbi:hypothetical protein [Chondromyces apiculatus]|uniref:Lipoprotein n=1 Tax=Chondromyces apiculatus DSM 436 TaxID=1192034 RepID=A0A017SYL4_9BACT|nr:hypothetical protein [Chondromyces apiculatus]EYF01715.1 Hypothetical protein CAP_7920 [Chondromyces apiculatus DSM 436]